MVTKINVTIPPKQSSKAHAMRIYRLKASEAHRPAPRIWASDSPRSAAAVVAPIRKLCPLKCELSKPQKASSDFKAPSKSLLKRGVPSGKENSVPATVPCLSSCDSSLHKLRDDLNWLNVCVLNVSPPYCDRLWPMLITVLKMSEQNNHGICCHCDVAVE